MKRLMMITAALVVVAVGCLAFRGTAPSPGTTAQPATPEVRSASSPPGEVAPPASTQAAAAPLRTDAAASQVASTQEEGDARLAAKLGLQRGEPSSVAAQLADYTAEELDLFAQVQRTTGRDPSPVLREIVEHRRRGTSVPELERIIAEKLAGDTLARATALRWLERYGAASPAGAAAPSSASPAAAPGDSKPLVAPLTPK